MIKPFVPRFHPPCGKLLNLPAKATPEIMLAPRMNMVLLQVVTSNAMRGGEMCLEVSRRVESCAAFSCINVDVTAPHLGLVMVCEFVLAPLLGRMEGFTTEKGTAVGFV